MDLRHQRGFHMARACRAGALPGLGTAVRSAEVAAELTATATILAEMAWAAQQTIALRLLLMGGALSDPIKLADPEFRLMAWEKLEAAITAGFALSEGGQAVATVWNGWVSRQTALNGRALNAVWRMHDLNAVIREQRRFTHRTLDTAELAATRLALAALRMGQMGMGPLHQAARANARRLSRGRPFPAGATSARSLPP